MSSLAGVVIRAHDSASAPPSPRLRSQMLATPTIPDTDVERLLAAAWKDVGLVEAAHREDAPPPVLPGVAPAVPSRELLDGGVDQWVR